MQYLTTYIEWATTSWTDGTKVYRKKIKENVFDASKMNSEDIRTYVITGADESVRSFNVELGKGKVVYIFKCSSLWENISAYPKKMRF